MKSRLTSKEIAFEDEYIIGINKPSGLLSIPDRYDATLPSVLSILRQEYSDIQVVHRIDKDTSGLLLLAKSPEAHQKMSALFENRDIDKDYLVLVKGRIEPEVGRIDAPLAYNKVAKRMYVNPRGKESATLYKVLEQYRQYALLKARLITGRMHQIRVHLHTYDMPFVCDPLYGDPDGLYLSQFKRGFHSKEEERPLMGRLSLHASCVAFKHPFTDEDMEIHAPIPKDFKASINQLRKWNSV